MLSIDRQPQDRISPVYEPFLPSNAGPVFTSHHDGLTVHLLDPPNILRQCHPSINLQTPDIDARPHPLSPDPRCRLFQHIHRVGQYQR